MKLKTKIVLAIIAIFAIMLMINSNVQASSTIFTIEDDTDSALELSTNESSDGAETYELELTEDVYANLVVSNGEDVTLKLKGYSFYSNSSTESAITVEDGATLTITSGGSDTCNLGKITVEEGGTLKIQSGVFNFENPIYNYGTLTTMSGNYYYTGEHLIVNEGTLTLASSTCIFDTEESTGYAVYNKGTLTSALSSATFEYNYGFLINEGTAEFEELSACSETQSDVPMIINKSGSMKVTYLTLGSNPNSSLAIEKWCNRIMFENYATLSVSSVSVYRTKAEALILQSSADAVTTYEESSVTEEDVPDNFEIIIYKDITLEDTETDIQIEAEVSVLSEDTALVIAELTSGTMYDTATKALKDIVSTIKVYDITLKLNGEAVEPEGNVKIYIPIPEGMDVDNLVAYRIDEDGTKTEYKVTVDGDYAVIETNHFSTYVLAELASTTTTTTTTENDTKTTTTTETSKTTTTDTTTTETSTTTTTDTTKTTTDELDETPKTGANEISAQISMLVALISIAGIAIIKRNH